MGGSPVAREASRTRPYPYARQKGRWHDLRSIPAAGGERREMEV